MTTFLPLFTTFADLKAAIQRERRFAERDARHARLPFVRSRGTWLATADKNNDQCAPKVAAECPYWNGTKREVEALVADVLANHPHVTRIYIEGGYDGADYFQGFDEGNYEPWISNWEVTVWERPAPTPDPEPVLCVDCDKPATHFTEADAPYDPHCDEHFKTSFTECPNCGEVVPKSDIEQVETARATFWSPAEWDEGCSECIKKVVRSRPLSRHERLQAAADAGYDTWAEYRGER